jgi:superfamily II DNA or RNA helicase
MTAYAPPILGYQWQNEVAPAILEHPRTDFMLVATPGAGKTLLSVRVFAEMRNRGIVDRIIIVAPTTNVEAQWAGVAKADLGLSLCSYDGRYDGEDGITDTYAAVHSNPELFAAFCAESPTLVVLDEVHHVGDDAAWGQSVLEAFSGAARRLHLSGTPFRSDKSKIAFLDYDEDGMLCADYSLTYHQAVQAGICRRVHFPTVGGTASWKRTGEAAKLAELDAKLSKRDRAGRLKAALDPAGGFVRTMLTAANARLSTLPDDAGGIVFVHTDAEARAIAGVLAEITGHAPAVVSHKIAGSRETIARFRAASGVANRWIVTVKMISEGTDIPRLRVGCFLTRTLTEMFFIQAVGRLVRTPCHAMDAWFYIPTIPEYQALAMGAFDAPWHAEDGESKYESLGGSWRASDIEVLGSTGFLSEVIRHQHRMDSPAMADAHARNREKCRLRYQANAEKIKERIRLYQQANREKIAEHSRRWYQANAEKLCEKGRLYRQANRDKILEKKRLYRQAKADNLTDYNRLYRQANRDKIREQDRLRRQANIEKRREQNRLYRQANRDKILEKKRLHYQAKKLAQQTQEAC